jgi:hypothetical protein
MQLNFQIRCLQTIGDGEIQGLSEVLIDCVEGGASVSFMLPMSRAKAEAYWRRMSASVARGERVVLAAEDAAGTSSAPFRSFWISLRTSRIAATSRRCSCFDEYAGGVLAQRCSPPPSASMHGKAGSVAAKYRITRCGPMGRLV